MPNKLVRKPFVTAYFRPVIYELLIKRAGKKNMKKSIFIDRLIELALKHNLDQEIL